MRSGFSQADRFFHRMFNELVQSGCPLWKLTVPLPPIFCAYLVLRLFERVESPDGAARFLCFRRRDAQDRGSRKRRSIMDGRLLHYRYIQNPYLKSPVQESDPADFDKSSRKATLKRTYCALSEIPRPGYRDPSEIRQLVLPILRGR